MGIESLDELLALDEDGRTEVDIARANLLVAQSTPGAEDIDIEAALAVLDRWTARVASETARHLHRFREAPSEYNDSEAYFRMLMLITVLQQDCGVRYHPDRIHEPDFSNPADLFIHGMIPTAEHSPQGGTCVSMPVLYVAVGRRLGYPLKLVTTRGHVFARWEDASERFNIEASGHGLSVFDDDHYKSWPVTLTEDEIATGGYLRSLTPDEELAIFLASRGHVLLDTGHLSKAVESYELAAKLDSRSPEYRAFQHHAMASLASQGHTASSRSAARRVVDPLQELRRINEFNRRHRLNTDPPHLHRPH